MSSSIRTIVAGSLLIALVGALGACATGPKVETRSYETPDGAIVVETVKLVATVEAIDARKRTVRLKPAHGDAVTYKASEEAVNFDQIRVGDEVRAEVVAEIAVSLIPGGAPTSIGEAAAVALAPAGDKPGIVMVDSVEATAKIIAIDAHAHTVTLEFLDESTKEVKVAKHRDLSRVALGDSVRVQITAGVALWVVTPPKG